MTQRATLLLPLLCWLLTLAPAAAPAQFTPTGGPLGSFASDALLAEGSDTVFLEANGLAWRSLDGGLSFTLCAAFPNAGFNPDAFARRGRTVYAATNSGDRRVFRSDDLGDTWENIEGTGLPNIFGFSALIPYHLRLRGDRVLLGSTTGLYVLEPGATDWTNLTPAAANGGFVYDLRLGNADTLFASVGSAAGGTGFVSPDGGTTWTAITESLRNGTVAGFTRLGNRYVAGQTTGGSNSLSYSDDGGATWILSNGGGASIDGFDEVNGRLYAFGTLGLWVTDDGANWTQLSSATKVNAASENGSGDLLYTSANDAFRRSGGPFSGADDTSFPLALATIADQIVVGNTLYATVNTTEGLFSIAPRRLVAYTNGTWTDLPAPATGNFFRYRDLADVGGTLRVSTSEGLFDYDATTGAWTEVPGPTGTGQSHTVYNAGPGGEVAQRGRDLYYRTGGGVWAASTLTGADDFVFWTSILDHDGTLYGFTETTTAYLSTDGGASWAAFTTPENFTDAVAFGDAVVYREVDLIFGDIFPTQVIRYSEDGLQTSSELVSADVFTTVSDPFALGDQLYVFQETSGGSGQRGLFSWTDLNQSGSLVPDRDIPVRVLPSHLDAIDGELFAAVPGWSVWFTGMITSVRASREEVPLWKVFPNPTAGRVTLEVEAEEVWRVVNGVGRTVLRGRGRRAELGGLPAGVYTVVDELGRGRARVVVE